MPNKPGPPAAIPTDSIDFEVTGFEQARAALDEPPPGVKVLKRFDPREWIKRRRPTDTRDGRLTPAAETWLDRLPTHVRPLDLPGTHPRIVNQLAEIWSNANACLAMLSVLVVDERGDRRGFSMRIALELVALREYRAAIERLRR